MLDAATHTLIARIHAAARPCVLEFAGAGSQALWWLHCVAGSSRTVLEATDRYSRYSMISLLGSEPARYVSQETAVAMAHAAFARAHDLSRTAAVVALSCTATIATDYAKKGNHGCWDKEKIFRKYLIHPLIKEVRGEGLMLAAMTESPDITTKVVLKCQQKGLILFWLLFEGCAIRITPPLTISESEIEEGCSIILQVMDEILKEI